MPVLLPLSFMIGTVVYAALAVWRASIAGFRGTPLLLALGFAGMAASYLADLMLGPTGGLFAEALRNAVWIGYLAAIIRNDRASAPQSWLAALPFALIALVGLRAVAATLFLASGASGTSWGLAAVGLSAAFCIGALIFIQSLYFAAHQAASGFKLILVALAILWSYDLNLYAVLLLGLRVPLVLIEGRGVVALLLAPLFALAARRKEYWSIALSRRVAFQSLSIIAIGGYLVVVAAIASARPWLSGSIEAAGQIAVVIGVSAATLMLLVSSRARGIVKVFISKHLFEHRYDYRAEWLRFNATINSGSLAGLSPEQRAVKALADLMDAAGGMLFVCEGRDRLVCAASFKHAGRSPAGNAVTLTSALRDMVEQGSHVMVSPHHGGERDGADFPPELADDDSVWVVVPLVRMGKLTGLIALGRPTVPRQLDWEDFDLLKVLGQQIATYVADAQSHAELEETRQFEEFNRRFAFIVHDIKNVVSQLSLVAANAEQHGANPRFQADMTSTLRNSAGKMTTLLSRLTLDSRDTDSMLERVDLAQLIAESAAARRLQHPVSIVTADPLHVTADRTKLQTAIDHLIHNAIEASAPDSPITLSARLVDGQGAITIDDAGCGMSGDFIRRQLFKPFASTKRDGFGIGAGEARTLVRQMGGELHVQSTEGVGTSFVITLPVEA